LQRLKKRGVLRKVTRNKYTTKDNIYVIATNIYTPSYLSFWSAAQYLGYTEQIVQTIFVATTRKRKEISFDNYRIKFVCLPKKYFFGFEKMLTEEGPIFVADEEKLLIDALLKPKYMGNFNEIIKVTEGIKIEKEKIVAYLKEAKNVSLMKRVGYMIKKYKHIDLASDLKAELRKDKNYILLNPLTEKARQIAAGWGLKI
jgi:predicted transcriptional regulator of viral defense system